MGILRKYQAGAVLDDPKKRKIGSGTSSKYKPTLTQEEIDQINFNYDKDVFIGDKKECAGDACRNLSLATDYAGVKNYYGVLEQAEKEGKLNNIPRNFFKEGLNSSWNNAGIANSIGSTVHYNSKSDKPEKLSSVFHDKLPVGTFVLLGNDAPSHPKGYSVQQGFNPSNHTLIVYGYKDDGTPLLMDGYDKQLYTPEKAQQVWGKYKIQTVFTPNEYKHLDKNFLDNLSSSKNTGAKLSIDNNAPTEDTKEVSFNSNKYLNNITDIEGFDKENMSRFLTALELNSKNISSDLKLNNVDYNRLAGLASGISLQESKGGQSTNGLRGFLDRNFSQSVGMTQLDLDQISPEVRKILSEKYSINDNSDIAKTPENSAIATMYHLAEMLNYVPGAYKQGLNKNTVIPSREQGFGEKFKGLLRGKASMDPNKKDYLFNTQVKGHTTTGNVENMPTEVQLAYGWRGLKKLKTGDASGKDKYVENVMRSLNHLNTEKLPEVIIPGVRKKSGLLKRYK